MWYTAVMDLRGKSVFLTGGARGLGRGIVEELLSLGAKVSVTVLDNTLYTRCWDESISYINC